MPRNQTLNKYIINTYGERKLASFEGRAAVLGRRRQRYLDFFDAVVSLYAIPP